MLASLWHPLFIIFTLFSFLPSSLEASRLWNKRPLIFSSPNYLKNKLFVTTPFKQRLFSGDSLMDERFDKILKQAPRALIKIIQTNDFQRLKGIDQSGPLKFFKHNPFLNTSPPMFAPMSRYEHSIGVASLILEKGKNSSNALTQAVAGLLHDISHSAFSHLIEEVVDHHAHEKSFQDVIHLNFIKKFCPEIMPILDEHGISLSSLDPSLYPILDQTHPHLCADRIDYLLRTAYVDKNYDFDQKNYAFVLKHLHYDAMAQKWHFTHEHSASMLANISLYYTEKLYTSPWNRALYHYFGKALKETLRLKINNAPFLSIEKLWKLSDEEIFDHMTFARKFSKKIDMCLTCCENLHTHHLFHFPDKNMDEHDNQILLKHIQDQAYYVLQGPVKTLFIKDKNRSVDPYVETGFSTQKQKHYLFYTSINDGFKKKYDDLRDTLKTGYWLIVKDIDTIFSHND
jgi:HD superfamily phosphohydrolase